jgi:hypothetical protein
MQGHSGDLAFGDVGDNHGLGARSRTRDGGGRAARARTWVIRDTCGVSAWSEFAAEAPELAGCAARLWPGIVALDSSGAPPVDSPCFSISYLATLRRDGAPRLHPFCPILAGGRLFAAIPTSSPKGSDLRRDPRCAIHALPGPEDDELCIRAVAREVDDDATKSLVRDVVEGSRVGGMIESVARDSLFEFDLEQVDTARWVAIGQPGTHAERQRWRTRTSDPD